MIIILIKFIYTKTQTMNLNSLYIYLNTFISSQTLYNVMHGIGLILDLLINVHLISTRSGFELITVTD